MPKTHIWGKILAYFAKIFRNTPYSWFQLCQELCEEKRIITVGHTLSLSIFNFWSGSISYSVPCCYVSLVFLALFSFFVPSCILLYYVSSLHCITSSTLLFQLFNSFELISVFKISIDRNYFILMKFRKSARVRSISLANGAGKHYCS